jgi:PadR family transcriptional regulator, regulatory protein PadR
MEIIQGTLDTLILKTLTWGPRHGYAVARWIRETTLDELHIEDGALYTSLHRMEKRGWVGAEWGLTPEGRRVKFYEITAAGRHALEAQAAQWARYTRAVGRVLQPA